MLLIWSFINAIKSTLFIGFVAHLPKPDDGICSGILISYLIANACNVCIFCLFTNVDLSSAVGILKGCFLACFKQKHWVPLINFADLLQTTFLLISQQL